MIRKEVEKLRGLVLTPEELEVILPIVATARERNVLPDIETEKHLWKIRYKENYNTFSCIGIFEPKVKDKESDIRELTTGEAEEWFQQFHKEKPYAGLFKLYHKKYDEWIIYKEGK